VQDDSNITGRWRDFIASHPELGPKTGEPKQQQHTPTNHIGELSSRTPGDLPECQSPTDLKISPINIPEPPDKPPDRGKSPADASGSPETTQDTLYKPIPGGDGTLTPALLEQMLAELRYRCRSGPLDYMRSGKLARKEELNAGRLWSKAIDRINKAGRERQGAILRAKREAWEAEKKAKRSEAAKKAAQTRKNNKALSILRPRIRMERERLKREMLGLPPLPEGDW
jgi:hypothetical protein